MNTRIIIAASAMLTCSMASAGTVMEYVTKNSGRTHTVMKISEGRVLVADQGQADSMLYTEQGDRMYIINHDERQYSMLDEEAMKRLSGQVDAAMSELDEQLASLPPAQREQMKKMMGGMMDMGKKMMEPEITRTGRSGEYSGIACEYVNLRIPNVMESEMCVAEIGSLDIPADDLATMESMNEHMQRISDMMSESLGMNIPFNQVGGIPVFIRDEDTPSGRVLQVNPDASVSGSEMNIPDGYREVPLEGSGGMGQ